jgi:voltage-gated potassium channel
VFSGVVIAAWAAFASDYAARLVLSTRRWRFLWTHLPDLAAVLLPMLRPLRLLRLLTVLSVLNRHAGSSLRGRVAVYVVGSTSLILLVASLGVLDAERGAPGSNIENFGDALWWSMTTITTVGYGDIYPVTVTGRFVAAGLMVGGIALLGVVTASFASWLLERIAEEEEESRAATRRDVRELSRQVESLRRELMTRGGDATPS